MKKLLLLLMVVAATYFGVAWGEMTATGASPFKSPEKPPKQVVKYNVQGDNAFAEFSTTQGCVITYATVSVGDSVSKEGPGKPAVNSSVYVSLSRQDSCTGEIIYGEGSTVLSAEAFSLQGNLDSATLNAQVPVTIYCCGDQSGSSFITNISLTWTGTGAISTGKSSYTSKSPGCKVTYTSQGDSRPAVATGSITALDTQFAAQPSIYASLNKSKNASMQVGCN